jgi:hypothetical protein
MLRASLLALPKNPRRNHLRFYCMVTANFQSPSGAGAFRGTAPGALVCDRLTAQLGSTTLAIIVMQWT